MSGIKEAPEANTESARQAAELASLRRMLIASQGTFSLSFAVCNQRALRDQMIATVCAEFPDIHIVAVPPDSDDVLDRVLEQLQEPSEAGIASALFVTDLEASIPFDSQDQRFLAALNMSREQWERFGCPVVFWLAEYAVTMLARKAADFWRYRSHQFGFVSSTVSPAVAASERFGGYDMVAAMPYEQKRFRLAEIEQRLSELPSPPPPQHLPHVLAWTYEMADLYTVFGEYEIAERLLRSMLGHCERIYGTHHTETAAALNNLVAILLDTKQLAEAEPLMHRALEINKQVLGPEHPNVARDLNNLAMLLQDSRRLVEAEPLLRRALTLNDQANGDNLSIITTLNNLASLLQATNRLTDAESLLRRALTISEQAYGDNHLVVAATLNNLGKLLQGTNRLAEAEPLTSRALAIFEAKLGREHPIAKAAVGRLQSLSLQQRESHTQNGSSVPPAPPQ